MTVRIYVVGTDTAIGKTHVCCALLREAHDLGIVVAPFKPAQSGPPSEPSDAERLLEAARLPRTAIPTMAPWRFPQAIAPGIASDPAYFLGLPPSPALGLEVLAKTEAALAAWEHHLGAQLSLIEAAGGLHVPMPGGTWQPQWVAALAHHVILVARAGLGTLNHSLLTIDALCAIGHRPLGFILSEPAPGPPDASLATNAQVITTARGVPHLGTLPFGAAPLEPLLPPLLRRLGLAP